jgi:hypothetical protein
MKSVWKLKKKVDVSTKVMYYMKLTSKKSHLYQTNIIDAH